MSPAERIHPNVVVRRASPNYSSRVAPISLIVIHATVSRNVQHSIADLAAIGEFFSHPATQASSHVCTDGDGNSARYVRDRDKAWHCAGYNSPALGIEQVYLEGSDVWRGPEYDETARWVARWSILYGVPIRHGAVSGGSVVRSGVLRHSELGAIGGGHSDPGVHYDLVHMLDRARHFRHALRVAGGHAS